MKVEPVSNAVGASISGIDLSKGLDAQVFAAIEKAFRDHCFVVFRGQDLTAPQFHAF